MSKLSKRPLQSGGRAGAGAHALARVGEWCLYLIERGGQDGHTNKRA